MLGRCEAHAEANLVLNDPDTILAVSRPVWLLTPGRDRFCWLQAALIREDQVQERDGILYVGSRPLWSREIAWSHFRREDSWAPRPSWETVERTQAVSGRRIFGLTKKESFINDASERSLWRNCDGMAVKVKCDLEAQAVLWKPGGVVVDTGNSELHSDTLVKVYELANLWDRYMGCLAQCELPLLCGQAYMDLYRPIYGKRAQETSRERSRSRSGEKVHTKAEGTIHDIAVIAADP